MLAFTVDFCVSANLTKKVIGCDQVNEEATLLEKAGDHAYISEMLY